MEKCVHFLRNIALYSSKAYWQFMSLIIAESDKKEQNVRQKSSHTHIDSPLDTLHSVAFSSIYDTSLKSAALSLSINRKCAKHVPINKSYQSKTLPATHHFLKWSLNYSRHRRRHCWPDIAAEHIFTKNTSAFPLKSFVNGICPNCVGFQTIWLWIYVCVVCVLCYMSRFTFSNWNVNLKWKYHWNEHINCIYIYLHRFTLSRMTYLSMW